MGVGCRDLRDHRTHWHDILAAHCPRFSVTRVVTVPIPQPIGFLAADDYKIQFSFEGERHITPWLHIIGKVAPDMPYVEVALVRSGDALRSVTAIVYQLGPEDQAEHWQLVEEFRNATHWPKHLLVSYTWTARHDVDAQRGLLVLFAAGGAAVLLAVLSAARSHKQKLRQFLADMAGEGGGVVQPGKQD
eukprot:scaffold3.g6341.t1